MQQETKAGNAGFTLVELLVSVIIGGMLLTSLFKLWNTNQSETNRIQNKVDYRDRFTIATTAVNKSITQAGFGMSRMDVIIKGSGMSTDTLTLYSNDSERRTTICDTARVGTSAILVFLDSGIVEGGILGITDSLHHEYVRVSAISGDTASGFLVEFTPPLQYLYNPGVPDIYPVQKERYYIDGETHALVHLIDDRRIQLASGVTDFRVDLRDAAGAPAVSCQKIRMVTFSMLGTYKAPAGTPNTMRFSSTVIPRNLL
jgi:prepilin-type N-terminal cleavage/methylation domain-containing protein